MIHDRIVLFEIENNCMWNYTEFIVENSFMEVIKILSHSKLHRVKMN